MPLPRAWLTCGSCPGLWSNDAGTYDQIPFEALPSVDEGLTGDFAWLAQAPEVATGLTFEQQAELPIEAFLEAHAHDAAPLGLRIPPSFRTLLTNPALQARIPSCTACYFDLGTKLMLVPGGHPDARMLRFLNDQQSCVFWYLLLEPDGSHAVATAIPEWLDDVDDGADFDDAYAPELLTVCADDFEAFIKRFWIENTLWFLLTEREENGVIEPLPPGELGDYARAAQKAVAEGRAGEPIPDPQVLAGLADFAENPTE
jgi:hypothetical protein